MPTSTGKRRGRSKRRGNARRAGGRSGGRSRTRAPSSVLRALVAAVGVVLSHVWRFTRWVGRALASVPRAAKRAMPGRAARRRAYRVFARLPFTVQLVACVAVLVAAWVPVNWLYQVVRKPSELLFPVSGALYKTPSETWATYAPLFRRHSTDVMTPDLLAALAQVEGSGNPIVRTYWRFKMTYEPFDIYRPASSAVGMYQITDGTFAEARRYCIRDHAVAEQGAWNDFDACWFNSLYTRTIPSHAIEMTSAYLDRHVTETLARVGIRAATLRDKQTLAAVIHLCGRGAALRFARQGLAPRPGERCGSHDLAGYLRKVREMQAVFARLAG
jgi:hypothetical protein